MADHWQSIRTAIVAKMAASTLMATAGLRSADAITDELVGELPCIKMLEPTFEPLDPQEAANAHVSEYFLTYPWELLMEKPAGEKRQQPVGAAIMRACQEEWRSGFGLGLSGLVVGSWMLAATPGLEAYAAETDLGGWRSAIRVQVHETHSARTF